jgi:hypothetical protein
VCSCSLRHKTWLTHCSPLHVIASPNVPKNPNQNAKINCRIAPLDSHLAFSAHAQKQPEGHRVTAYNSTTHEWTIIRTGTFDGEFQKKRLVVVCKYFVNGDEHRHRPDACDLHVGQFLNPHRTPDAPLVDILNLATRYSFRRDRQRKRSGLRESNLLNQ